MPRLVQFLLSPREHLWRLTRDGEEHGVFSHLEQGVHEATRQARALQESGEPAGVAVELADGRRMTIDVGPEAEAPDLSGNAAAFVPSKPL